MRSSTLSIAGALLVAAASALPAQAPVPIMPGTEVRVRTAAGSFLQGTLTAATWDTLVIALAGSNASHAVSMESVTRIYRPLTAAERRRTVRGGLGMGLVTGMLVGGMVGAAVPVGGGCPDSSPDSFCMDFSGLERAGHVLLGGLVGALGGAVIGAAVGESVAKNGWKEVRVARFVVLPPRDGELGLATSVTVAF